MPGRACRARLTLAPAGGGKIELDWDPSCDGSDTDDAICETLQIGSCP